ncbi:hypothetical protein FXO38_14839 [Capsicum annuum]|nr:hypothetical protein FXO37_20127 [Capsicum annuum]KAF3655091.1 hypothetical protein FXO38_14839 [Capsicum annuum]
MDEIWINYCRMLVGFGMKEFVVVTDLRCDHLKEPLIKETPSKISKVSRTAKPLPSNKGKALSKRPPTKTNKCKEKIDGLLDIVECDYRATMFLKNLKDKTIPKKYKEQLCLVWFVYSIILTRDVNKVIKDDLMKLAEDFEKFNNYP